MSTARTIVLQGELSHCHEERMAGEANILPGMCLMINADNEFVKNTGAAGNRPVIIAKEDDLQGKTIDDLYADEEPVFAHRAMTGDKVQVRLAVSQTITIDEMLEYNNAGRVVVLASGVAKFQAAEAVTTDADDEALIACFVI